MCLWVLNVGQSGSGPFFSCPPLCSPVFFCSKILSHDSASLPAAEARQFFSSPSLTSVPSRVVSPIWRCHGVDIVTAASLIFYLPSSHFMCCFEWTKCPLPIRLIRLHLIACLCGFSASRSPFHSSYSRLSLYSPSRAEVHKFVYRLFFLPLSRVQGWAIGGREGTPCPTFFAARTVRCSCCVLLRFG